MGGYLENTKYIYIIVVEWFMQLGFSNSICLQFQNSVIYFVYFLNYKIIVETDMRRLVLATLASLDSFDFKEKKYSNSICILYCVLKSIFIYF